jgi:hypothetical protein
LEAHPKVVRLNAKVVRANAKVVCFIS